MIVVALSTLSIRFNGFEVSPNTIKLLIVFLQFCILIIFLYSVGEHIISEFDIHSFIQLGLRVVQFRMTKITKSDKVQLLELLDRALKWCCEKYEVSAWPVGLTIDVPNAVIKTGLRENVSIRQCLEKLVKTR